MSTGLAAVAHLVDLLGHGQVISLDIDRSHYQVSHPHRLKAFEGALEHIAGRSDVWLATGREIAQHYLDTSYDAAVTAIAAAGATASGEGTR